MGLGRDHFPLNPWHFCGTDPDDCGGKRHRSGVCCAEPDKDYLSGLVLLLEGQLRIGDIVDIGGVAGQVEEMTLRYVRLRQLNGDVVYVPNGAITNLTNKTTDYSMAVIDVGVAYRENLQEALNVMESVARELASETTWSTRILAEPEVFGV